MQQQRSPRRLRIVPVLALALLGAACNSTAPGLVYATGTGSVTGDGLHRVRWSQMGSEFVKPGAQLGGYAKVLIEPLVINTTAKGERRRMGPTNEYEPTPSYLDGMRSIYLETFTKQFGRDGFSVVGAPGPGVLRLSGLVVDLVLTARLDPEADTTTRELITSFGDLSLLLDLRDSTTNEPLLRTVDRQPISQNPLTGAVQNSTGANLGAQREVFAHEALLLQQEIRQLQNMGTVPAPPQ
jgi:hypothetical protein